MEKNLHNTEEIHSEKGEDEKVLTKEDMVTNTEDVEHKINKLRDTIATDPSLSPKEKETFLQRIAKLTKRTREIVADVAFFPAQFLPERKTTAEYNGLNLKETLRLLEYKTAGYENPKELFLAMREIKALFPESYPDVYIKHIAQIFSQNKNMVQIFDNLKSAGWSFYDAENILEKHASDPELLSFSTDPALKRFEYSKKEVAELLPVVQKYGVSLSCLIDFYEKNPTYKQPKEVEDQYLYYSRQETTPNILKQFYTSIPKEVIQKYYSPEIEKYKKEFTTYIGSEDFSLPPDILPLLSEETMPKIRTLLSTEKKFSEYQKTNQIENLSRIAEFPTGEKILDILLEENVPLETINEQKLAVVHAYLSNPDFQKSINEIRSKITEKIPILPGDKSLSVYAFFEIFQKNPEAFHALPALINSVKKIQGSPWTPRHIGSFLRNNGLSFLVNPEKISMLQKDMGRLGITNIEQILSLDTRTRHNIFESNFTETLAKHAGDFQPDSSFFRMEHFEEKITLLSSLGINPEMTYEYGLNNTDNAIGTQKTTELQNMITTLQTTYKISPIQTKEDTAVLFRLLSNNSYDSYNRKIFSKESIEHFKKLQSDIPFSVEPLDIALFNDENTRFTFSEEIKPLVERLRQKNLHLSLREIYNIQKTFTESGKKSDEIEKIIDLGVDFKKYHNAEYVLQRIQNSYHDEASYCISNGISIRTNEEYDGLQILFAQGIEKILKKYTNDPVMRTFLLNTYASNLKYADTRPESWHEAFLEQIIETRTQAFEKNIPEVGIQSILELITSHHLSAEDTTLPFDTELAFEIIDFVNRNEKNSNLIQKILEQRKKRRRFNLKEILSAITKVTDSENPYIQKNKEVLIASIVEDVHIHNHEAFVNMFEEHQVEIQAAEHLFDFNIFQDENIEKTLADIIAFKPTSALSLLEKIPKGKTLATLKKNMGQLATIPKEKLPDYFAVFILLEESPSQEMQRIKGELTNQILSTENPAESYKKIEAIFIKNNIPLVGKIFNIFQVLHPQNQLQRKINDQTSPILQETARAKRGFNIRSKESVYALLYSDLLNIHVRSGNRALAEYAHILASGETLLSTYEERELTEEETDELSHFLLKIETLLSKSQLATRENSSRITDNSRTKDRIQNLRESFGVAKGESFGDRISAMFLRPTDLSSLSLIPKEIERFRNNASIRNEASYEGATEKDGKKYLSLSEGDLLKGVPSQFLENILQNGSVAKEFLGASSDSDATPFDTDLERISKEASEKETQILLTNSITSGYGDIQLHIKDRGQFQKTVRYQKTVPPPEKGKYELFQTGAISAEHYGIRTGFPSTEIDALILSKKITQADTEKIFFEIAKNGFYIPVADETGKIIFTPEQYKTYRTIFSGIERYGGAPIVLDKNTRPEINTAIQKQLDHIPKNRERTQQINTIIRSEIGKTLRALDVHLKSSFDTSILGAELHNTGSTGRGTNLQNDFDFDLILRLDTKDFSRVSEIYHAIKSVAQYKTDNSHESAEYIQLRLSEVSTLGNQTFDPPIDIDIGFNKKSDLVQFGSHNAIEERLDAIEKTTSKDARDTVVANIILAKELLKKAHAYKKFEDGGMGGIGVENWILAHGGSVETAFQSFLDVAVQNGRTLPYEEFVKQYSIIDPGINLKFNNHDNFIKILKPEGYEKMIRCIQDTLHS